MWSIEFDSIHTVKSMQFFSQMTIMLKLNISEEIKSNPLIQSKCNSRNWYFNEELGDWSSIDKWQPMQVYSQHTTTFSFLPEQQIN